jgi:hypothetical protein
MQGNECNTAVALVFPLAATFGRGKEADGSVLDGSGGVVE